MARNETAKATIYLDGKQAEAAIDALKQKSKELKVQLDAAKKAGDTITMKKLENEIRGVDAASRSLLKDSFDVEKVLKNINKVSWRDLEKAQRSVTLEMKRMERGTEAYAAKEKDLKKITAELNRTRTAGKETQSAFSRMGDGFNKYFGMATAAIASLTGIAFTVKSSINTFAEFDDKLADVMKTTGLTKIQVKELNDELSKIDTRTSQTDLLNLARVAGKLGITAKEDILGFVRAADQISVALSEDLGGAEDAVRELGKLTDIFKLKDLYGQEQALLKIGSAINELGMASTANEGYLVEFSKRTAGIAPQAGVSIQNILGLAATLDSLGQQAEMSSTAYSKMMTTMTKKTGEFAKIAGMEIGEFSRLLREDANEAMIRVFEGLNKNAGGFEQLVSAMGDLGIEGQRMTSVFGALANNTKTLREQQALANKSFAEGTSLTNEFAIKNETAQAKLEKARKGFVEMQRELGERLSPAYASVIHKGSVMIKMLGATIEFLFNNRNALITAAVAIGSYTVAVNAATWAIKIYNGITTIATTITKGFNTAVKANPVGLIISLLTTAATAFYLFGQKADIAQKSQKKFNDEIKRGNELLGQSKTLEERASIVKNLSKEQLENLKNDLQSQIKEEENFHATLLQKAQKAVNEDAELSRINEQRKQKDLTEIQKINLAAQAYARKIAITRELEDENKTNQQRLANLKKNLNNVSSELKKRPNTNKETPTGDPDDGKAVIAALEIANQKRILELQQQYAAEENMQKFLHARLLANELAYLHAKEALETDESKKLALQTQIVLKQVEYNKATKETIDFLRLKKKVIEQINPKLLEEGKIIKRNAQIAAQAASEQENLNKQLESQAQRYQDTITVISDGLYEMMSGSEDAFKTFAKNIIIFALEQLKVQAQIAAAGVTVQSLASPESIATFGVAGLAKAALIVGLIEAAFAGIEGLVNNAFSGTSKKGYAEGGHTAPGSKYQPAGIVHAGEYVIPQEGTQNPTVRRFIDIFEIARKNGSLARLDLSQLMAAIPARPMYTGGFSSNQQPASSNQPGTRNSEPETQNSELASLIAANTAAIKELVKYRPTVAVETIEREREKYIRIKQTQGL